MLKRKNLFSLRNMSIEKKLPLSIFFLLFIIIVSLTGVSYYGVYNASLAVGEERLKSLTDEFTGLLNTSTMRSKIPVDEVARSSYIIQFLQEPSKFSKEVIIDSLTEESAGDTLNRSLELWSVSEKLLLSTGTSFNQHRLIDTLFDNAASTGEVIVGKISLVKDSMLYPILAAVKKDSVLLGYFVRWRVIKSSEQSIKQITGLLGEDASLYVGNDDGTLWTDLITVKPPPLSGEIKVGQQEYRSSKGKVLAGINRIEGAPWMFIIELSKDALLETADRFLQWAALSGLAVLLIGIILSIIMSRNITKPLNELTSATSDIAKGNYQAAVDINRDDELGRLAESFNSMVVKVRDSKKELEKKVQERTVQLKSANVELEDLNNKLKEIDEIKTNFFTNISHELRTPLALILGPVEKMLSLSTLHPADSKELSTIQQNARILLRHVNNLLDLSKLEAGKLNMQYSEFDFSGIVKITASYFDSLAAEENIMLKLEAPSTILVQADLGKIERVLMNLFSNAFKYTPPNGTITGKVYRSDDNVVFEIIDSGQGIKPEFIGILFERFSSGFGNLNRNLGSSGLGLSIVKEFIDMHGGTITAYNSGEGGAVFKFTVPVNAPEDIKVGKVSQTYSFQDFHLDKELARKPELSEEIEAPTDLKLLPGVPTILVVEDNIQMNRFITEVLNEEYNVISAFNGAEGLQKAGEDLPDLILTDVMMPEMSGDILVEKLMADKRLSSIPIILLTAKANEKFKIELLKKGAYDYLSKPFSIAELKARIANIMMIKSTRDKLQGELHSYVNDISLLANELVEKKQILESSLSEKEILIKEIHHRVKNNLQIISSLLSLQSDFIKDEETLKTLVESQNRIRSMALVHEQLYTMENLSQIDMERYIKDLVGHLISIYKTDQKEIIPRFEINKICINIDIAITLGLIINELVTNSVKYAFNGRNSGEIFVSFRKQDNDQYQLLLRDNGHGINKDTDLKNGSTLGLLIVQSLTSQLDGEYSIDSNNGTEINILFPVT